MNSQEHLGKQMHLVEKRITRLENLKEMSENPSMKTHYESKIRELKLYETQIQDYECRSIVRNARS